MKHSPATFCGLFTRRQRSERPQQVKSHDPLTGPACQGKPHGSCQAPANGVAEPGRSRHAAKNDGFPSRWALFQPIASFERSLEAAEG